MKLNEVRHFYFLKDNINFHEKKNKAVWRGNSIIRLQDLIL